MSEPTDLASRVSRDAAFAERFQILGPLGKGGMGEVHRAVQKQLDRAVAIKFLSPALLADPDFQRRFLAEAKLAAGLVHSHVVAVFDFGIADSIPFIVTEMVEGTSLERLRLDRRVGPGDAAELGQHLLDGLIAIHELGIVHRDPANLLVRERAPRLLKIADFGIARQTATEAAAQTATGMVVGTPRYMSPEQAAGDHPGPATDIYAAGLILFEIVTGAHPFEGNSMLEMMRKHIHEEVTIPPTLPRDVAAFFRKALAKLPRDRFASTVEMRAALAAVAPQLGTAVVTSGHAAAGTDSVTAATPALASEDVKTYQTPAPQPAAATAATPAQAASRAPRSPASMGMAIGVVAMVLAGALRFATRPPEPPGPRGASAAASAAAPASVAAPAIVSGPSASASPEPRLPSVAAAMPAGAEPLDTEDHVLDFVEARVAGTRTGGYTEGAAHELDLGAQKLGGPAPLFEPASNHLTTAEDRFLEYSPPGPASALVVLIGLADAVDAETLPALIYSLHPLQRVQRSGVHPRLTDWSGRALFVLRSAAGVDDQLAPGKPAPVPAYTDARFPALERVVAEALRRIEARLREDPVAVRRALLFAECLAAISAAKTRKGEGSGEGSDESFLISSFPETCDPALKLRLAAELDHPEFSASATVHPRTLAELARGLRLPCEKLTQQVESEAPPRPDQASPSPTPSASADGDSDDE